MIELKVYEAFDGKRFDNKEDCKRHEETETEKIFEWAIRVALADDGSYYLQLGCINDDGDVIHCDNYDDMCEVLFEYFEYSDDGRSENEYKGIALRRKAKKNREAKIFEEGK